jgi:hypothetical protein
VTSDLALVTFASPSETLSGSRGPFTRRARRCRGGLARKPRCPCAADPVGIGTPLLGLSMIAPPSKSCTASTPGRTLAPKSRLVDPTPEGASSRRTRVRPSARRCQPPDSFRPCRSSRLRRLAPLCTSQVFCALLPTMGFATFHDPSNASHGSARKEHPHARLRRSSGEVLSCRRRHSAPLSTSGEVGRLAVCGIRLTRLGVRSPVAPHPSKLFPRRQPCHVTVVVALSPLNPGFAAPFGLVP